MHTKLRQGPGRPMGTIGPARQHGLSLLGLIFFGGLLFFVALLGMKLTPAYIEYFNIQKHLNELARSSDGGTSPKEIQGNFDKRASIDDITSVQGRDLEITKNADSVEIRATYSKKIPLGGHASLVLDFDMSSSR